MNISPKFVKLVYSSSFQHNYYFRISATCYSSSTHLIERVCQKHPELKASKVSDIYENLVSNGLTADHVDLMLSKRPGLTKLPISQLEENLKGWLQCQLGCERVGQLLTKHTDLLFVSAQQVGDRFSKVTSLFSQKKLFKAVMNSPSLFTEDWDCITQKIDYLSNRVKLNNSVIASSGALAYPLAHLQVRFEFLLRAGVYVLQQPKSSVIPKNPSVSEILHTDDTNFAKKVAFLSVLEFEAFKQMFADEDYIDR